MDLGASGDVIGGGLAADVVVRARVDGGTASAGGFCVGGGYGFTCGWVSSGESVSVVPLGGGFDYGFQAAWSSDLAGVGIVGYLVELGGFPVETVARCGGRGLGFFGVYGWE